MKTIVLVAVLITNLKTILTDISKQDLNYTFLMQEYYLLCGPEYFCLNASQTHQYDRHPTYSYAHLEVCPECSCDFECVRIGNCCPDIFFALPKLQCVNRTIIQGQNDNVLDQHVSEPMVVTCPPNTDETLREKCESQFDTKSRLQNFPVTGQEIPLTYYNQYCAECHEVKDFILWSLDINCRLFADFNFLSTLDEVISTAYEKQCIFQAYLPRNQLVDSRSENCYDRFEETSMFTKCNETGLWKAYDANILYACESRYVVEYRLFKNIFCYMCNPSRHYQNATVGKCNVTGQWKAYDAELEHSCLLLPHSPSTQPYKNIFCYLCNRPNITNEPFVDVSSSITEFAINGTNFNYQYNVTVNEFDLEFFSYFIQERIRLDARLGEEDLKVFSVDTIKTPDNSVLNLTRLLHQEIALYPRDLGVCEIRKTILPPDYDFPCSCHISCVFNNSREPRDHCCADLAIELRTSCLNRLELTTIERFKKVPGGYLVIDLCYQEVTIKIYQDRCQKRTNGDIFSSLPVNIAGEKISYSNLYCVMCNQDSKQYIDKLNDIYNQSYNRNKTVFDTIDEFRSSSASFEPWDLEIICPQYLDYSHYLLLGDVIDTARKSDCRIQYINSLTMSTACDPRGHYKCSELSDWTYAGNDVEWACKNLVTVYPELLPIGIKIPSSLSEELDVSPEKNYRRFKHKVYQNPFCALCEPVQNFSTKFISSCNETGLWHKYDHVVESLCHSLPTIYYYYPFKNWYCVICNGITHGMQAFQGHVGKIPSFDPIPGVTWFPVLRNLFSVSDDKHSSTSNKEKCDPNQKYDYHEVHFYN